jgi:plasmid stabilization system protein ParE
MTLVRYHPAAAEEAFEAAVWYEGERNGLGLDFSKELETAIGLLREAPDVGVPHPGVPKRLNVKRILLKRFPYDVVYVERLNTALILAVAHQARRPGYWRARLRA